MIGYVYGTGTLYCFVNEGFAATRDLDAAVVVETLDFKVEAEVESDFCLFKDCFFACIQPNSITFIFM